MSPAIIRASSFDAANLPASPVRDAIDAARYENSLLDFIGFSWSLVEPMAFIPNWHIEAICDHLEACANWQINRLLINIPPRHMKSLAVNVFFPAWLWAQDPNPEHDPNYPYWIRANSWRGPGVKSVHLSYEGTLSTRDSRRCRDIITSAWYQRLWGHRVKLRGDQNQKTRFDNLCGGFRLATSEGGVMTGVGGDIIAFDDPHNVRDIGGNSKKREKTLRYWEEALPSRLNDQKHGVFIVVMQRVHEKDLSGHILAKEHGWTHLCLPALYEPKHPFPIRSTVKRISTGQNWTDPRQADEVLWPEKFPREDLDRIAKDESWSSHVAAGQLQQRPTAPEGAMFKRDLFSPRQPLGGDRLAFIEAGKLKVVRAWDLAWTDPVSGNDPDWTVGVLMGVSPEEIYYVLDVFRARLSPGQLEDAVMQMAAIDGRTCRIRIPEDPGAGKFVSYQLAKKLAGYDVFVERESGMGNKAQRAAPLLAQLEHRTVVICESPPPDGWNEAFIEEFCAFRPDMAHAHDDQVDATCAAFRACVRRPSWAMIAA
jgi:predicted phage terminase large subunit-like protein